MRKKCLKHEKWSEVLRPQPSILNFSLCTILSRAECQSMARSVMNNLISLSPCAPRTTNLWLTVLMPSRKASSQYLRLLQSELLLRMLSAFLFYSRNHELTSSSFYVLTHFVFCVFSSASQLWRMITCPGMLGEMSVCLSVCLCVRPSRRLCF